MYVTLLSLNTDKGILLIFHADAVLVVHRCALFKTTINVENIAVTVRNESQVDKTGGGTAQRCVEEAKNRSFSPREPSSYTRRRFQITTGTVLLLPHSAMVDFRPRILPRRFADTVPVSPWSSAVCTHHKIRDGR
jgi:hypothetical protein